MEINRFSIGPKGADAILNYTCNNLKGNAGASSNHLSGQAVGVNPLYPYIGDPLPQVIPPTVTVGTGTATSWPPAAIGSLSSLNIYANPFGALGDFFNVQYLMVEAVCAVTHQPLKPGEPVLILDEHVISKAAFMKLLRKSFEKMMVPKVEEMHELSGYDS